MAKEQVKTPEAANQASGFTRQAGDTLPVAIVAPNQQASLDFVNQLSDVIPAGLKVKRLTLPPFVTPADIPLGVTIAGLILGFVDSPATINGKPIKGKLVILKHAKGRDFCAAVTGQIRETFAPKVPDDSADLLPKLREQIGRTLFLTRLPDKRGKVDAQGRSRTTIMWDIIVSEGKTDVSELIGPDGLPKVLTASVTPVASSSVPATT